jgi:hypothetical protein
MEWLNDQPPLTTVIRRMAGLFRALLGSLRPSYLLSYAARCFWSVDAWLNAWDMASVSPRVALVYVRVRPLVTTTRLPSCPQGDEVIHHHH